MKIFCLLCMILLIQGFIGLIGAEPSYRLLWQWPSGTEPVIVRYEISVNKRLEEEEFKDLVLRVVKDQNPKQYDTLMIYFYYDLDEYVPAVGHSGIAQRHYEHFLGSYTWNKFYATKEGGGTLRILKDKFGNDMPQPKSIVFNHLAP